MLTCKHIQDNTSATACNVTRDISIIFPKSKYNQAVCG